LKHWAALLFCGTAFAHDGYLARWQALHARQPEAVSFLISAAKSEFYSGELIPLELSFTSTQPNGFLAAPGIQDRGGRMNGLEEFLVDPAALTEDPLRGLPGATGAMGGIFGGPVSLSDKPYTVEKLLNEWVRFRKPGRYRIAVLSRRVAQINNPITRPELVSNILTLHIPGPCGMGERTNPRGRPNSG
jgi:hypothetical protein